MKRVLIFSLAYYPFVGGAEIAVKEITSRIDGKEIAFDMVTLRYDRRLPRVERVWNVMVYRIGFTRRAPSPADLKRFPLHYNKFLYQLLAPLWALFLHWRNSYDAVWAIMAHSAGVPAALFTFFHPSVPLILTLQEGDPLAHIRKKVLPALPLVRR